MTENEHGNNDGDEELVSACPECDSTQIARRNDRGRYNPHPKWWCRCGARFNDPRWRPPKAPGRRTGLSQRLADADPDDVAPTPDGGRSDG